MRFNFEWYDLRAFAQNERNARLIEKLYDDAIREASRLAASVNRLPGSVFSFRDFPALNKRIEDLFRELASNIQATISNGTLEAWALGNAKNDALLSYIHKSTGIAKDVLAARYKWGVRNEDALKAFQTRKTAGMNLSQRVWNYTRQAKADIESAIDVALGEGTNAAALSRQIRKHLNEPDRLFRRVRDKGGRLRLSRAAKSYHPGQGVYRSSFKNSMRLARNEINMAYRESDHLRWSQMNFVKGVQVKISNNPRVCPLCRRLAGAYPKDFRFVGWHPQCRCFAIPILATNDEFEKLLSDPEYKLPGQVQSLPGGAKSWHRDNTDKIKRAKSVPYFFADNKKFFQGSKAPVAAPSPAPVALIPDGLNRYAKELGIRYKKDIFTLLNNPVTFSYRGNMGAYFDPDNSKVVIPIDERRRNSKWYSKAVIYHEFGHAVDHQLGLFKSESITSLMDKYREAFAKDGDKLYRSIDEKLDKALTAAYMGKKYDRVEKIMAANDTLMALNPSFGKGHTPGYWRISGNKEREFIAHMFENKFSGNDVFKRVMPDLYEDMIKVMDDIIKQRLRPEQ